MPPVINYHMLVITIKNIKYIKFKNSQSTDTQEFKPCISISFLFFKLSVDRLNFSFVMRGRCKTGG